MFVFVNALRHTHTYVTIAGSGLCWGLNSNSQAGYSGSNALSPTVIASSLSFLKMSAGWDHVSMQ